MCNVYQYSFLTIAAQSARSHTVGCFARRSHLMHIPCKLFEEANGEATFVDISGDTLKHKKDRVLKDSPLYSRVWTIQERLLSPRILHFGAMPRWECCERMEWEGGGKFEDQDSQSRPESIRSIASSDKFDDEKSPGILKLAQQWEEIIQMYTKSEVTVSSDRSVALQGVITYLEQATGYKNLAGLWRPTLLPSFFGYTVHGHQQTLILRFMYLHGCGLG
jgi:hypothetical protein